MAIDPVSHAILKLLVFIIVVVFVAYVLTNAFSVTLKKAQYYEYKKTEEYQLRVKNAVSEVKNKNFLENIGFDYKFGLLPGQSEVVDGVKIEYSLYDEKTNTIYVSFTCPDGKTETFHFLYKGVETGTNVGYYCDFGGTETTIVGSMIISPAVTVVASKNGEVRSELPYLTFYLKVIEKPSSGEYKILNKVMKPGETVTLDVSGYNVNITYDYIGTYSDVLVLNAVVTDGSGNKWSLTLLKILTGKVRSFGEDFDVMVSRLLYLPDGEYMVFSGSVRGEKPDTLGVSLVIGLTKGA